MGFRRFPSSLRGDHLHYKVETGFSSPTGTVALRLVLRQVLKTYSLIGKTLTPKRLQYSLTGLVAATPSSPESALEHYQGLGVHVHSATIAQL